MFVGFIAVVVILLVVVGLMSTGATNGSGGVDQTKATKVISEISALTQSAGFYKTTQADSDYAGVTVANLVAAGIVDVADTSDTTAIGTIGTNTDIMDQTNTKVALGAKLIKSKAVPGVYYNITVGTNTNQFKLAVLTDAADLTTTLESALRSNYTKLNGSAAVAAVIAPAIPAAPATDSAGMLIEFR